MPDWTDKTVKIEAPSESQHSEGLFQPGQIVGGKYKIISLLGTGGMGAVYRVRQLFLEKDFALKTLDIRTGSAKALQRFQLEAKAASLLNHPNLVHVNDFGLLDDEQPYLVMEFVNGITFANYLKEHGPLPVTSVAPLFSQVCFGLLAAHDQGVVHRDIKPGNLMLVNGLPMDAEGSVKVVDFGIVKITNTEPGGIQAITQTGEICGSPLYMSPEQCTGGKVDHRSDIYSLGCVLFEMLTGAPPHLGPSALRTMMLHGEGAIPTLKEASLGNEFPEELERVVAKMLQKSPEDRYQNIGLVAHDLAAVSNEAGVKLDARPTKARATSTKKEIVSMSANRFYALLAATALCSACLVWGGGYLLRSLPGFDSLKTSRSAAVVQTQGRDKTGEPAGEQASAVGTGLLPDESALEADTNHREALDQSELLRLKTIESTIKVSKDGAKMKRFVFPSCGIGKLSTCDKRFSSQFLHNAKGEVLVPDVPLALSVARKEYPSTLHTPAVFGKIASGEFAELSLDSNYLDRDDAVNTAEILKNVGGWSNLQGVAMDGFLLNATSLIALNNLKHLRYLRFNGCEFDSAELGRQPFLNRLEYFCIYKYHGDADGILRRLAGSSQLQELVLGDSDRPLSSSALGRLETCSHLQVLLVRNKTCDDKLIESVVKLRSLRMVHILGAKLSIAQVEMLAKCSWLEWIQLSRAQYVGDYKSRVQAVDRRIIFESL